MLPNEINSWDWPDRIRIQDPDDSYSLIDAPAPSTENLEFLADKYNELLTHIRLSVWERVK